MPPASRKSTARGGWWNVPLNDALKTLGTGRTSCILPWKPMLGTEGFARLQYTTLKMLTPSSWHCWTGHISVGIHSIGQATITSHGLQYIPPIPSRLNFETTGRVEDVLPLMIHGEKSRHSAGEEGYKHLDIKQLSLERPTVFQHCTVIATTITSSTSEFNELCAQLSNDPLGRAVYGRIRCHGNVITEVALVPDCSLTQRLSLKLPAVCSASPWPASNKLSASVSSVRSSHGAQKTAFIEQLKKDCKISSYPDDYGKLLKSKSTSAFLSGINSSAQLYVFFVLSASPEQVLRNSVQFAQRYSEQIRLAQNCKKDDNESSLNKLSSLSVLERNINSKPQSHTKSDSTACTVNKARVVRDCDRTKHLKNVRNNRRRHRHSNFRIVSDSDTSDVCDDSKEKRTSVESRAKPSPTSQGSQIPKPSLSEKSLLKQDVCYNSGCIDRNDLSRHCLTGTQEKNSCAKSTIGNSIPSTSKSTQIYSVATKTVSQIKEKFEQHAKSSFNNSKRTKLSKTTKKPKDHVPTLSKNTFDKEGKPASDSNVSQPAGVNNTDVEIQHLDSDSNIAEAPARNTQHKLKSGESGDTEACEKYDCDIDEKNLDECGAKERLNVPRSTSDVPASRNLNAAESFTSLFRKTVSCLDENAIEDIERSNLCEGAKNNKTSLASPAHRAIKLHSKPSSVPMSNMSTITDKQTIVSPSTAAIKSQSVSSNIVPVSKEGCQLASDTDRQLKYSISRSYGSAALTNLEHESKATKRRKYPSKTSPRKLRVVCKSSTKDIPNNILCKDLIDKPKLSLNRNNGNDLLFTHTNKSKDKKSVKSCIQNDSLEEKKIQSSGNFMFVEKPTVNEKVEIKIETADENNFNATESHIVAQTLECKGKVLENSHCKGLTDCLNRNSTSRIAHQNVPTVRPDTLKAVVKNDASDLLSGLEIKELRGILACFDSRVDFMTEETLTEALRQMNVPDEKVNKFKEKIIKLLSLLSSDVAIDRLEDANATLFDHVSCCFSSKNKNTPEHIPATPSSCCLPANNTPTVEMSCVTAIKSPPRHFTEKISISESEYYATPLDCTPVNPLSENFKIKPKSLLSADDRSYKVDTASEVCTSDPNNFTEVGAYDGAKLYDSISYIRDTFHRTTASPTPSYATHKTTPIPSPSNEEYDSIKCDFQPDTPLDLSAKLIQPPALNNAYCDEDVALETPGKSADPFPEHYLIDKFMVNAGSKAYFSSAGSSQYGNVRKCTSNMSAKINVPGYSSAHQKNKICICEHDSADSLQKPFTSAAVKTVISCQCQPNNKDSSSKPLSLASINEEHYASVESDAKKSESSNILFESADCPIISHCSHYQQPPNKCLGSNNQCCDHLSTPEVSNYLREINNLIIQKYYQLEKADEHMEIGLNYLVALLKRQEVNSSCCNPTTSWVDFYILKQLEKLHGAQTQQVTFFDGYQDIHHQFSHRNRCSDCTDYSDNNRQHDLSTPPIVSTSQFPSQTPDTNHLYPVVSDLQFSGTSPAELVSSKPPMHPNSCLGHRELLQRVAQEMSRWRCRPIESLGSLVEPHERLLTTEQMMLHKYTSLHLPTPEEHAEFKRLLVSLRLFYCPETELCERGGHMLLRYSALPGLLSSSDSTMMSLLASSGVWVSSFISNPALNHITRRLCLGALLLVHHSALLDPHFSTLMNCLGQENGRLGNVHNLVLIAKSTLRKCLALCLKRKPCGIFEAKSVVVLRTNLTLLHRLAERGLVLVVTGVTDSTFSLAALHAATHYMHRSVHLLTGVRTAASSFSKKQEEGATPLSSVLPLDDTGYYRSVTVAGLLSACGEHCGDVTPRLSVHASHSGCLLKDVEKKSGVRSGHEVEGAPRPWYESVMPPTSLNKRQQAENDYSFRPSVSNYSVHPPLPQLLSHGPQESHDPQHSPPEAWQSSSSLRKPSGGGVAYISLLNHPQNISNTTSVTSYSRFPSFRHGMSLESLDSATTSPAMVLQSPSVSSCRDAASVVRNMSCESRALPVKRQSSSVCDMAEDKNDMVYLRDNIAYEKDVAHEVANDVAIEAPTFDNSRSKRFKYEEEVCQEIVLFDSDELHS